MSHPMGSAMRDLDQVPGGDRGDDAFRDIFEPLPEDDSRRRSRSGPGLKQDISENVSNGSPWIGAFGLVCTLIFYRWFSFYNGVDLGDNDFAGLFYIIIQFVLVLVCGGLALAAMAEGISGFKHDRSKRGPAIGLTLGVLTSLVLIIANR